MKKLYPIFILFLIYGGCEDKNSLNKCNSGEVELWGECYSIKNTTSLDFSNNEISGSIPPEIGNLTNLTALGLSDNQLSGEIPGSICNLSENIYIYLSNNQLCPPYPSCIEGIVGEQDTTNCGS